MNSHSKGGPDEVLRSDLEDLDRRAVILRSNLGDLDWHSFVSKEDGVRIVSSICEGCKNTFNEVLEDAKARVVSELPAYCIRCDKDAEKSSRITRIRLTVMISW